MPDERLTERWYCHEENSEYNVPEVHTQRDASHLAVVSDLGESAFNVGESSPSI